MGITFKLIKYIGTLAKSEKGEKKLQLVSWNNEAPCYDIRTWKSDGKATSGITLSKEDLLRIVELVKGNEDDTEDFPINKPFEDVSEPETKKTATKTKVETKPVEKAKTKTNYTYSDCEKKLDDLFSPQKDNAGFMYVLEALKEIAKVDSQFVQNVMRKSRTFNGMINFISLKVQAECEEGAKCGVIDENKMIPYAEEYFNEKETETTKVAKTTTKSAKMTTKKTSGRKTKSTKSDEEVIDLPFN